MTKKDLDLPSEKFIDELIDILKNCVAEGTDTFSIGFDNGTQIDITFKVYGRDE